MACQAVHKYILGTSIWFSGMIKIKCGKVNRITRHIHCLGMHQIGYSACSHCLHTEIDKGPVCCARSCTNSPQLLLAPSYLHTL